MAIDRYTVLQYNGKSGPHFQKKSRKKDCGKKFIFGIQ